jgi:hypothetical protein
MVSAKRSGDDAIVLFVTKAIDLGATEIEVEYESGWEHIFAVGEHSGVEIATLKSSGKEARALRETLCDINEQPRKMMVGGSEYALTVQIHQSFGEDVYRITIKRA